MEISRDTLLWVIKAARAANRLAQDTKALLMDKNGWTVSDEIAGFLNEALFNMIGEKLEPNQDFTQDSITMLLIRSNLPDGAVADEVMQLHEEHAHQQPKPNLLPKEELQAMAARNGYVTPERDWK